MSNQEGSYVLPAGYLCGDIHVDRFTSQDPVSQSEPHVDEKRKIYLSLSLASSLLRGLVLSEEIEFLIMHVPISSGQEEFPSMIAGAIILAVIQDLELGVGSPRDFALQEAVSS
jgi:hypothetical protein